MVDALRRSTGASGRRPRLGDLGAGAGRHALHAASRGMNVHAVERHRDAVARLRRLPVNVTVHHADFVEWLHLQHEKRFDALLCFDAVHHVAGGREAVEGRLKLFPRILRSRGHLVVSLLCDIAYSAGGVPPDRSCLTEAEGCDLLDNIYPAAQTMRKTSRPVQIKNTLNLTPEGEVVTADYSAHRLVRWYVLP
jgi:SAM-dependent methyltransferase